MNFYEALQCLGEEFFDWEYEWYIYWRQDFEESQFFLGIAYIKNECAHSQL